MKNILRLCLLFEVMCSVTVLGLFRVVHPKEWDDIWAGSLFVALGVAIVRLGVRRPVFRHTWTWRVGLIHLFATSLPMLATRVAHYGMDFSELRIWGVAGPMFHGLSEAVYAALVLGTLVDIWATRVRIA